MNWQKYFNNEKFQGVLLSGLVVFLVFGIAMMSVMLQWQFNSRMQNIERAAVSNNNRLAAIEDFFIRLDEQVKKQQNQEGAEAMQGLMSPQ